MINPIMTNPNISQHKREQSSTLSKQSVNSSACVKNRIKREPAEINFCGLFSKTKLSVEEARKAKDAKIAKIQKKLNTDFFNKILTSDKTKKILETAGGKQALFQASFALILTCGFRPLSILLMPSKKNKDDQKYASAHSIASGVIGFIITSILLAPFNNAFKKVQTKLDEMIQKGNYLENKEAASTAKIFVGRLTDWVPAIPKGILTIALIPPILKYVFGIEKKKHGGKTQEALTKTDYSLLNFKSNKDNKNKILSEATGGSK